MKLCFGFASVISAVVFISI